MTPEEIEREREKKAAAFKAQQRRWKLQNELEQLSTGMFFIGFVLFMFGLAADPTRFDLTVGGSVVVVLAVLLYFISQR